MTKPLRILIVDDHIMLREGLVSLIKPQPDFEVVGEAGSVAEAIQLANDLKPDLVLMDFGLPDGTGLDATKAILEVHPDTKIVFLTVHEADDDLFAAIRYGAKGYLLKNVPVSKMLQALRGMGRGEAPLSREMTSRVLAELARSEKLQPHQKDAFSLLTSRELEVLRLIARGATNQQIADELFISVNTVKNHVHNMLEKLELKDRYELADYAGEHGLE